MFDSDGNPVELYAVLKDICSGARSGATVVEKPQFFVLRHPRPMSEAAIKQLRKVWDEAISMTEFKGVKLLVLEEGMSLEIVDAVPVGAT